MHDLSSWQLSVMCVVIVASLAIWLIGMFVAASNPQWRTSRTGIKGPVQGGRHIASGGRSVSPDRGQLATESGIPAPRTEPALEPQPVPLIPRQTADRDASVPMPTQRAESPADSTQPINRP
jgi:hypothetical protein